MTRALVGRQGRAFQDLGLRVLRRLSAAVLGLVLGLGFRIRGVGSCGASVSAAAVGWGTGCSWKLRWGQLGRRLRLAYRPIPQAVPESGAQGAAGFRVLGDGAPGGAAVQLRLRPGRCECRILMLLRD